MTYFDKPVTQPLPQLTLDKIEIDRKIPEISLESIRYKILVKGDHQSPKDNTSLEYLYHYLSQLSINDWQFFQRRAKVKIYDYLNELSSKNFISDNDTKILRDACYANFKDCLNEYNTSHPKKSSREASDFLSSVNLTTLCVMKYCDPSAISQFTKLFLQDYGVSFPKLLDIELLKRGISIDSRQSFLSQLRDAILLEAMDIGKSPDTNTKIFDSIKLNVNTESQPSPQSCSETNFREQFINLDKLQRNVQNSKNKLPQFSVQISDSEEDITENQPENISRENSSEQHWQMEWASKR